MHGEQNALWIFVRRCVLKSNSPESDFIFQPSGVDRHQLRAGVDVSDLSVPLNR